MGRLLSMKLAAGLALLTLFLAACGGGIGGGELPTMAPTPTAAPHATPTMVPLPDPDPVAEVDWEDLEPFRLAMRPEFAHEIDDFADYNRYTIEATVELTTVATINGSQRVRHTNRTQDTYDHLVFRMHPNLLDYSGARMNISDVQVNGERVVTELRERNFLLIVPLADLLEPGESVEVLMDFNTSVEAGFPSGFSNFHYLADIFSGPEWYPILSVYEEGRGWWMTRQSGLQGETAYGVTSLFDVRMTADENQTVVLSGTEIDTIDNGDGTLTHHVVTGPMRDNVMFVSPRFLKLTGEYENVTVNLYYWDFLGDDEDIAPDRSRIAAEVGLDITLTAVDIYTRTFGEYPFNELDVLQTANTAGGIEYPGVFIVNDQFWNAGAPFFEAVLVHETSHQWWYSLVGNDQTRWPFLDEALAGFSEYVYYWGIARTEADIRAAEDYIRNDQLQYNAFLSAGSRDVPIGWANDEYDPTTAEWGIALYAKAPLFYYEIAEIVGRDQTYAALAEYFRRNRYGIAEPDDLLAAFEDVTGMDWDPFFYEWIGDFPGLSPAAVATVNALQSGGGG